MPSVYTHHRFGAQALPKLPAELRGLLLRNRTLYDLGLQGPDFFFYFKLGKNTPIRQLASDYHRRSGNAVFSKICRELPNPAEGELAYLYGLLGHFCLDAHCHPLVHQITGNDGLTHNALESEFERYLLEKDGFRNPHRHLRGAYLRCGRDNARVISRFYPEAEPEQIRTALRTMGVVLDLLTIHGGAKHVLAAMGGANPGLLMKKQPDPAWENWNPSLEARLDEALAQYPVLAQQLCCHITSGEALGEGFDKIFG